MTTKREINAMTPQQAVEELMDRGHWNAGTTGEVSELFRVVVNGLHAGVPSKRDLEAILWTRGSLEAAIGPNGDGIRGTMVLPTAMVSDLLKYVTSVVPAGVLP